MKAKNPDGITLLSSTGKKKKKVFSGNNVILLVLQGKGDSSSGCSLCRVIWFLQKQPPYTMTQQLRKHWMLLPLALWDVLHSLFVSDWFKKSIEGRVCGR